MNKYKLEIKNEVRIMTNFKDEIYEKCVNMTGKLGHAGHLNSKDGTKNIYKIKI